MHADQLCHLSHVLYLNNSDYRYDIDWVLLMFKNYSIQKSNYILQLRSNPPGIKSR